MAMVINSNIMSLNAQRNLTLSQNELNTSMERLTSGKRINSAADDAAGLSISNRMTSQVRGLNQAIRNANDGASLIQTAEGALDESTNILQRMRELSIQSANGTYDSGNRGTLNAEVKQLVSELDRIAETTSFNGLNILDGSLGKVDLQVGSEANQTIELSIQAMDSRTLGLGSTSVDIVGGENSLVADTTAINNNDIMINGQSIMAVGETWTGGTDDMDELIDKINTNVNGVTASTIASATSTDVGDGILAEGETFKVDVKKLDGTTTSVEVTDTENMDQLVDKLNAEGGGLISASVGDDGKLTITAENVESLTFTDGGSGPNGAGGTLAATTASIALSSDDGAEVTIERGTTGTLSDLESFGFRESNEAGVIEGEAVDANAFAVGDLKINGVDVGVSETGGLIDKVAAINDISDETGVTASVFSGVEIDTSTATGAWAAGDFTINGEVITSGADLDALVTAINGVKDSTGVTATLSGQNLLLEGDVSQIAFGDASGTADNGAALTAILGGGVTVADAAGGIKLSSDNGNPISVDHKNAAAEAKSGLLDANSAGGGSFGAAISSLDISTAAGAQKAIGIIDNALEQINSTRGDLGAVSNRLDFTVNNLSNVSENVAAARSRIEDADFAAESAALSRAQVLQQAGTAMLAQANAAPQQVLSLLQ
ncbi:flagellin [Neptunomonas concharum]|uniref:Flagellin n=1 Tax=Neptunomonas concharum TaxID=1031538 RepID=A0A5P1R920_9GAMM|nr:flagellin [Neptunomonas concharum]QEQ95785.1 flagellin [Neptunomonas concharum]